VRGLYAIGFFASHIDARLADSDTLPNAIVIPATSNLFLLLCVVLCGLGYI